MPLSNDFDSTRSLTARGSFAVLLDVRGDVAGADAEGGLAARVGGPDHGVAAGGQDGRDAGVVHQRARSPRCDGCSIHWMQCSGRPGRDRRVPDDPGGLRASTAARGVEGEDDRVARLQRDAAP